MSSRPSSTREGDTNRGSRRDGEKASKPYTHDPRDGRVNDSTRLHSGASSRAQHLDNSSDTMARSSYRAPPPRSPRNARRSRSPYRAPHSKRRSASRSPSHSRSDSRSPSNSSRRGVNARLRSRSPPPRDDARTGDKRPRSSNHYQSSSHSDPRRFKVHFEKEKEETHRGRGQSAFGKTGGHDRADKGRLTHNASDDGRLSRDGVDLPSRHGRDRATNRDTHSDRVNGTAQNSDKASNPASSKTSSLSQSAHNPNNEAHRNGESVAPKARYVASERGPHPIGLAYSLSLISS